jgi:hypothetical protein
MTCDQVELALVVGEGLSEPEQEHLAGCEKCQAFQLSSAQLVQDAALPPVSASEKAALSALAPRVLTHWKQKDTRRGVVRRFVGLALAACMGAAVASAALVPRLAQQGVAVKAATAMSSDDSEWTVPSGELTATDSDDELDFEVSWPNADTTTNTNTY